MPSSHSATVCALAASAAFREGIGSSAFALSVILATVVMYDAMGIRQAAGVHAREINEIKKQLGDEDDGDLPEKLGHRPIEVISGAFLAFSWPGSCAWSLYRLRLHNTKNHQRRGTPPPFFCARKNGPRRKRRKETGWTSFLFRVL